jgi:WD40 repeat protein
MYSLAAQHRCRGSDAYVVALACEHGSTTPRSLVFSVSEPPGADEAAGGRVEVLDLPLLRPTMELHGPHAGAGASDLGFLYRSPQCLVTCGGDDGAVKLWDLRAGTTAAQRIFQVTSGGEPLLAVTVASDDRLCACAGGSSIHVLDLTAGREVFAHEEAHSDSVGCLRFHPQRAHELVSGGDDGLLCVLDVRRCEQGGAETEEDAGLRLVVNNGETVRAITLVAECSDVVCATSTIEVLQLWSLHEQRPGALCGRFADIRAEPMLRIDESDGYIVDVFYDDASGHG